MASNNKKRSTTAKRPASSTKPAPRNRRTPVAVASSRSWVLPAVIAGVVVLGLLILVIAIGKSSNDKGSSLASTLSAGGCTSDTTTDTTSAQNHVANPVYTVEPPAGGNHLAVAATPRFYDPGEPVPPDGQLVHSLEHGLIVYWYQPTLPADQLAILHQAFDKHPENILAIPRKTLPAGTLVAATAWNHRILCKSVALAPLEAFVVDRANKSPEKLNPLR